MVQPLDPNELLALLNAIITKDKALREAYQIGDKFKFIRDKLLALQEEVTTHLNSVRVDAVINTKKKFPDDDELLVYVYLYNSHGLSVKTWQKMLSESVLYEYSVNRPIYSEMKAIEGVIRGKKNMYEHGYLSIIIKKQDVLTEQDAQLKVREGCFKLSNVLSLVAGGRTYEVNAAGQLVF